jgi:hypothetical protein
MQRSATRFRAIDSLTVLKRKAKRANHLAGKAAKMIERLLEYWAPGATEPVTIRVCIGAPEPTVEGNYKSTLSIEGFDTPYSAPFIQVDSLGAVLAAASIAPVILYSNVEKGGRLTWLEGDELSFPLLRPPKHYWTFRPTNGGEPQQVSITITPPQEIQGQWACLVTLMTAEICQERWVKAETWAQALERAAATVPTRLQEFMEKAGGGLLEDSPSL